MVTNYIKNATYKEIYDIHTDSESTSILTLHTPINNFPRRMLQGFFTQYRKFKYCGATVSMRPASRLPADPEGVSYEAGEPGVDPRDILNPVLYRGYSGESLGTFLNRFNVPGPQSMYNQPAAGAAHNVEKNDGWWGSTFDKTSFIDTDTVRDFRSTYLEKLYYQSLSDPGWKRVRSQGGMKKFFYPLVYELATTTQRLAHNVGAGSGIDTFDAGTGLPVGGQGSMVFGRFPASGGAYATNSVRQQVDRLVGGANDVNSDTEIHINDFSGNGQIDNKFMLAQNLPVQAATQAYGPTSNPYNRVTCYRKTVPILTSNKRRLGWLDTDSVVIKSPDISTENTDVADTYATWPSYAGVFGATEKLQENSTTLPQINMGIFIFPKSYKHEMYWRLTVTHHFDFCKYRPRYGLVSPFDEEAMGGNILEWSDWDGYGEQVWPQSSVTSSKDNVDLIDVEGLTPEEMKDSTILPNEE